MPGFDFDASAQRSIVRQGFVDKLLQDLYRFARSMSRDLSSDPLLLELHIALLDKLTPRVNAGRSIISQGNAMDIRDKVEWVLQQINKFSTAKAEREMILLTLCTRLFSTATSRITIDFATWESLNFREKV